MIAPPQVVFIPASALIPYLIFLFPPFSVEGSDTLDPLRQAVRAIPRTAWTIALNVYAHGERWIALPLELVQSLVEPAFTPFWDVLTRQNSPHAKRLQASFIVLLECVVLYDDLIEGHVIEEAQP